MTIRDGSANAMEDAKMQPNITNPKSFFTTKSQKITPQQLWHNDGMYF
ncbi:hypothetical protein [Nostoc sp. 'Peltigera membranacea cyanobiont' 232]|nr:hypothetical protein [Nostoc sp. 'Peltigera membranacea cyanobiont' 232]